MSKIHLTAEAIEGFVDNFLIDRYEERRPTAKCHRMWWRMVTSSSRKVAFAAPRGHGKSTALNHAYGLAASLFQQHPFQIKVSKTYALACEKIEQAKQELLDNEKIKHIFRLKKIVRDRENDFIAEMADGYRFRMMALGMMQATRGLSWGTMRPTLIQGDDLEDDEEVMNKDRRDKAMSWIMKTLLPMGGERTEIRIYGTVLHNDSCLVRLLGMKSWNTAIFEACDNEVSEKSILWPQKFPQERLQAIKQEYIDAGDLAGFNMEYRNQARDTTSGYFRAEDLVPMGEGVERKKLTYYIGVDFAISEKQRSDYTVMVVAGLDDAGMLYVVDVTRIRTEDGNKIIDAMFELERAYNPAEWFLEEGAIRKALGAALELRQREEGERGLYLNMRLFTPSTEKTVRAKNIQARIRAKAVRFNTDAAWWPDYEDELTQFPRGKHDDQCDATAYIGLGLADMVTPLNADEEEEEEREFNMREQMSLGRSAVTGY